MLAKSSPDFYRNNQDYGITLKSNKEDLTTGVLVYTTLCIHPDMTRNTVPPPQCVPPPSWYYCTI